MKKRIAIFTALTILLAMTACGSQTEQTTPTAPEKQENVMPTLAPVLTDVSALQIPAEQTVGRLPVDEYALPGEVVSMTRWVQYGGVGLLARAEDASLYALAGKESNPALLCWGDRQAEFDWQYATPRAIEPQLWVNDWDGDGETEVAADCYGGSGTGVSLEYLYVVERDDGDTLISCELPWEAVETALNAQLRMLFMNGGTYAVLGRELVDISADLRDVNAEKVQLYLGPVVSYYPVEEGFACSFGVVAEGDGIPPLSRYVATVEGMIYYKDRYFTLKELHILS